MPATLLFLLLASTAYAQPPGEVQPLPAPAQPQQPSVMDRRWSVAVGFGSLGLKPDVEDADSVSFGMFELSGRFRIIPAIEVGLSVYGGGAMKGELSTGGLYIDGRYRFLAENPWNVFALLSLGVASVATEDQSEDEKKGRGSVRVGFGVERRFRKFGIAAELRLIGVGKNDVEMTTSGPTNSAMATEKLSGGSLTIGGTFYF